VHHRGAHGAQANGHHPVADVADDPARDLDRATAGRGLDHHGAQRGHARAA
jgi:hypothetical protein